MIDYSFSSSSLVDVISIDDGEIAKTSLREREEGKGRLILLCDHDRLARSVGSLKSSERYLHDIIIL